MNPHQIVIIEDILREVDHVTWDRYTTDIDEVIVYGWIEREQDKYKDFIVVSFKFDPDMFGYEYSFVTSSAKYSEYFHMALEMDGEHVDCSRVEDMFKSLNSVHLV
jgi:hypothetical protein